MVGASIKATLIGVWASSWKVKNSEIVSVTIDEEDEKGGLAPLGMGVVTPAYRLLEIFESAKIKQASDTFMKRRDQEVSAQEDMMSSVDDLEFGPPIKDENPQHKEDFNRLLGEPMKGPKSKNQT